uniref:Meiosis inhibitor 1 n=1 Tax=Anas platyrhynchos platyrhynchos TaxID=8840 RepID=A0A493T1G2_ANAPP
MKAVIFQCCMFFRACHFMNFPLAIAFDCLYFLLCCSSSPSPPPSLGFQKDLLLSQAVVACLETLLEYLYVKNQDVALHVASQPWHRFLLLTLLNGGQKSVLQPEILRLVTLFVRYQSSNVISQKEISLILREAAEANLPELPEATSRALHLFLRQVQSSHCQMEAVEAGTVQTLLEHLSGQRSTCAKHQDIVCLGGVAVSLAHIGD